MTSHFEQFIATIARLRAPDGCPWDREQTHQTLARFLLEEAYEVLEAIHIDDPEKLKEELGDLLLQVVLNAQVAKDENRFDLEDVAAAINAKMIRRHPHVFGDTFPSNSAGSAQEVLAQWEELKAQERKERSHSALDGVPNNMPALFQALKISEKAVKQGFEWNEEKDIWRQLDSELAELKDEIAHIEAARKRGEKPDLTAINLEMGDVLFTVVNIARWHKLNPEESLLMAIAKFKTRFVAMEKISAKPLKELRFDELEALWVQAKAMVPTSDPIK